MSSSRQLKQALNEGSTDTLMQILNKNPALANTQISRGLFKRNCTEPLHYVSDCVFDGRVSDSNAAQMATILLQHGAAINGRDGAEPPLIGATSLNAGAVANVLIEHGADITRTALFGATALHWAAFTGLADTVALLLSNGADCEVRCTEFDSTPLFWAVQGFSKYGPEKKSAQVEAVSVLISHGARIDTCNSDGVSALHRSRESASTAMTERLLGAI